MSAPGKATHYDVLGVAPDADASAIRKAYLRASLRSHPDKNPGREEEAKAEFVLVGRAYEVLSDPSKRAAYDRVIDRELAGGRRFGARPQRPQQQQAKYSYTAQSAPQSTAGTTAGGGTEKPSAQQQQKEAEEHDFDWFMGQFDETVGGMSEEELNMAVGAAAVVGSIVGSILGARAARGNNSLLSSAASIMGSRMASHAASTLVRTVHEDAQQRTLEKQERREAIARGETVREPSAGETRERVLKDAGKAFQKVAGAAVGGTSQARRLGSSFGNAAARNNDVQEDRARFNWGQAARLACMAANACAEMQCGQKRR